ncbi:MAG: hypothetical protein HY301_21435 [Verrucomicrobia bacterium]|nr:hypothetical protein [Verrucomicrobiota bacterium]
MMYRRKLSARVEHRQQEAERSRASASLAEKFPQLKSLTVELSYFSPDGGSRGSQIKYTVNPAHAKSVFRFDCQNHECVRGDFDLSMALAQAVAARRGTATGEVCCQGWLSKTTIDSVHCRNLLRYKLSLEYTGG